MDASGVPCTWFVTGSFAQGIFQDVIVVFLCFSVETNQHLCLLIGCFVKHYIKKRYLFVVWFLVLWLFAQVLKRLLMLNEDDREQLGTDF